MMMAKLYQTESQEPNEELQTLTIELRSESELIAKGLLALFTELCRQVGQGRRFEIYTLIGEHTASRR